MSNRLLCVTLAIAGCTAPSSLQEGRWTGSLTPMNHLDSPTPIEFNVSSEAMSLIGPDGSVIPLMNPVLDGEGLRYSFREPEQGVLLNCNLELIEGDSFEGKCTDPEGQWALFRMIPPSDSHQPAQLGRFDVDRDLLLTHFDLKTDVDDVHSVAGVATMLADPRFNKVRHHAVAGAYGTQEGLYVPANELFDMAFGENWSDAHGDFEAAVGEVSGLVVDALASGGTVWIADGGQSDFSATVVQAVQERRGDLDLKDHVHIVQHADWNEEVTDPENLAFVKAAATYHRLPDGNASGNGTPGFRSDELINWRAHVEDPRLVSLWERAVEIGDTYNGVEGRYLNTSVQKGGLDFSDASETTWIFGFTDLVDANDFFLEFGSRQP